MSGNRKNEIEFLQHHLPVLMNGEYLLTLKASLKKKTGGALSLAEDELQQSYSFTVSGERFQLKPQEIQSVFPPEGSLGDHANVLPHLILTRSTLPWERSNGSGNPASPWLALLLFYDEELAEVSESQIEVAALKSPDGVKFPILDWEEHWETVDGDGDGESKPMRVNVIDVKNSLLKKILPAIQPAAEGQEARDDLKFLAHTRITEDQESGVLKEWSVVIGNRLPKNGGLSTAHLVSLEGFYDEDGYFFKDESDAASIRLVSLHSWRFACLNHKKSFGGLLKNLNNYQPVLHNDTASTGQDGQSYALRLPAHPDKAIEQYYKLGYLPLQHALRNGRKTVSWYRSPLSAGGPNFTATLPARASDELLKIFQTDSGQMLDTTYAAAWELGRLLTLQNKAVSLALFQWKRAHAQSLYRAEQQLAHLPVSKTEPDLSFPNVVQSWFDKLSLLQGIPFCYLVPDERMLPPESIRFFKLDRLWIESLLDGAFSTGRVMEQDYARDKAHEHSPAENAHGQLSGFILRSALVPGWPDMKVEAIEARLSLGEEVQEALNNGQFNDGLRDALSEAGIEQSGNPPEVEVEQQDKVWKISDTGAGQGNSYYIKARDGRYVVLSHPIERRLLSPNIMLCFFRGTIKKVDFFLKAESLHFGLEQSDSEGYPSKKEVRGPDGTLLESDPATAEVNENGLINIAQLADDISGNAGWSSAAAFTSAQFALSMIEGSPKVSFEWAVGQG